ncbi:MAG: hypothetical protein GX091_05655 [Peptococcaceae bacterium]|nr:hypothetical protein [Peptococcaceae bacterium]
MVMPAMGTNLGNADGTISDNIVNYYARRAAGGVGLVVTEVCSPEHEGICPSLFNCNFRICYPGNQTPLFRLLYSNYTGT